MIITRYLTREILQTLLSVIVILLLAFLSQQMVRYLNYAAIGKIPTNVMLTLVGFEIPYLLSLLLPLGLYLAILLTFGRLHADHELSILQMCGFGNKQLMRLTLRVTGLITFIILLLMLWVNPIISAKRQQLMSSDEATLHLIQTIVPGRFQVSPDGAHVMYVEKLSRDRERAENVFLAQEKKIVDENDQTQSPWMVVFAKLGYQVKDKISKDQFFVTTDGYRYEGIPGQSDYKIIQYKNYFVRIPQNDVRITHPENEALSSQKLWQDYANPKRAAELQWRLSIGISAVVLALLAIPLSHVRPRGSRYIILLPAILIYVIYINLLFIARHWLEQDLTSIMVGLWWVHSLFILLILGLLFSHHKKWIKS
ncbi:MAG: LPS export ABC transporter permease LptF [Gammaproteobacteria bacterium]|nr:LPS export ABC transporter permease LptF [Gammaproteobacteria bacterium]